MNVLFISPHFPTHFYLFCRRLKDRGVTVLGLGDTSWEQLGDNCRGALSDYRGVTSLKDYDQVYHAVADFIFHYGRIDFVESQNEYWLELDARIRTDFNITSGPKLEMMPDMNRKSRMKAAYKRAGIPAAPWRLPSTLEEAEAFAEEVGYPVIVKPDKGVGAADTRKLKDSEELADWWESRDKAVQYIEEMMVPGHVETFDGITDSGRNVLFAASQCLPRSLMDAVGGGQDVVSYCQAPGDDLRSAGEKLLKEFDTRNRFFHFEFFRLDEDAPGLGKKGEVVGLEVNMRAPGGRIPDKMNYAYDTDVYTIWADSLIYDRCFMETEFRHFITHVGRKNAISYAHTYEDIRHCCGDQILEEIEVSPVLADEMGDHAYLLKSDSLESRDMAVAYILERA